MSAVVQLKGPGVLERFNAQREAERRAVRVREERVAAMLQAPGARRFTGAPGNRLLAGLGGVNTGINVDLEGRLGALRAASRDLTQNTDMGRRFEGLVKRNVIGAQGIRLQVRAKLGGANAEALDKAANDAVETHYKLWCEVGECEVTNRMSMREVHKLVLGCLARDGEYLVRRIRNTRFTYGYKLQVLDVDRLDLTHNLRATPGQNSIRMGVEIDTFGAAVAYWLTSFHPGDPGSQPVARRERVPASEIFHGFMTVRPEQLRGFPWTHAVMNRLSMLNGYEEAAVVASRVGASKMGFYQTAADAPGVDASDMADGVDAMGNLMQEVEPGMVQVLPPGVTFSSFNPDYPQANYDAFVTAAMRSVAAGLDVANHNLTGNMSGVNYSSARVAELGERDVWRDIQQFFIESFVRPVYREWLSIAMLMRKVTMDSGAALPAERFTKFYMAGGFQARGWLWVDPKNEAEAAVIQINNRLRSRRAAVEEQGGDLEDIHDDEVAETALFADLPAMAAMQMTQSQSKPAPAAEPATTGE